jgi:hypothetical protein
VTGTIGFYACFWFVRKIYSSVKIDWLQAIYGLIMWHEHGTWVTRNSRTGSKYRWEVLFPRVLKTHFVYC